MPGGRNRIEEFTKDSGTYFINNAAGNYRYYSSTSQMLISKDCNIATLICPMVDTNGVEIGDGCILPEGCTIARYHAGFPKTLKRSATL